METRQDQRGIEEERKQEKNSTEEEKMHPSLEITTGPSWLSRVDRPP